MKHEDNESGTGESSTSVNPINPKVEYEVRVTVSGSDRNTVKGQMKGLFPGNDTVWVCEVNLAPSIGECVAEAINKIETGTSEIRYALMDLESALDDISEDSRSNAKREELESAISALEETRERIQYALEACDGIKIPNI